MFRSTAAVDTGNCFGQCDSCDPLHGFQAPSSEHSESLLALLVGLCCCLVSAGCLTSWPMHNVLSSDHSRLLVGDSKGQESYYLSVQLRRVIVPCANGSCHTIRYRMGSQCQACGTSLLHV